MPNCDILHASVVQLVRNHLAPKRPLSAKFLEKIPWIQACQFITFFTTENTPQTHFWHISSTLIYDRIQTTTYSFAHLFELRRMDLFECQINAIWLMHVKSRCAIWHRFLDSLIEIYIIKLIQIENSASGKHLVWSNKIIYMHITAFLQFNVII